MSGCVTRWSDNKNGPLCLQLHRWQENTLSEGVFLETWINTFDPLSFPGTFRPHLVLQSACGCVLLCAHICFCVCACVCGPLAGCYYKCYKNLQRKRWGWVTPICTPINLCFFTSILLGSSHFVETQGENHILGNTDPFRKQFKALHRFLGQMMECCPLITLYHCCTEALSMLVL